MINNTRDTKANSKLYDYLIILIGILHIAYILLGFSLGWGFYFGLKVIALYGVLFLAHGILRCRSLYYRSSRTNKAMNIALIFTISFIVVMESFINFGSYVNPAESVDYLFVLGAGIVEDRPSLELKSRLDKAIAYVKEGNAIKKIVLCGGKGENKEYTEAYVMEKYLLNHGIDQSMLIEEGSSTTTYENIQFAISIIERTDQSKNKKVALVSNDFHLFRAKQIAKKLGLKASGLSAETPLYIIPNHHVREYFAILKYFFID